jgi:hypothetical protein
MPATLLRELAKQAGVHCYLPQPQPHDVIYANRSLVALSVSEPGPRTVVLPRASDVFDQDRPFLRRLRTQLPEARMIRSQVLWTLHCLLSRRFLETVRRVGS